MNKVIVTLSQSEWNRVLVLQRVVDGHLTVQEAALVLGLSERHIKRLKKRFLQDGAAGLAHGNRGRRPVHTVPGDMREKVLQLAQTKYRGCNYTFSRKSGAVESAAADFLEKHHGGLTSATTRK